MNTRELTRREELCRSLNMDFDEAAELFSDETLESMQMAKINGGSCLLVLAAIITIGAGGVAIYDYFWGDGSKTTGTATNVKTEGSRIWIDGRELVGFSVDTVGNNVRYTYTYKLGDPTPTTANGWHPPMASPTK